MVDISVVLLTNNTRFNQYVRAIKSVCIQTYLPKELIIVNADPSSDTWILKKKITKKLCHNISDVYFIENVSQENARNMGAHLCKTDWICFLDDDDEWFSKKIEVQVNNISETVGLIYCDYFIEDLKGNMLISTINNCRILEENFIGSTSFPMVSKKIFDEIGGFDSILKSNQEWELWVRFLKITKIIKVDYICGIKHYSSISISKNKKRRVSGWNHMFIKNFKEYLKDKYAAEAAIQHCYRELYYLKAYVWSFFYFILYLFSRLRLLSK